MYIRTYLISSIIYDNMISCRTLHDAQNVCTTQHSAVYGFTRRCQRKHRRHWRIRMLFLMYGSIYDHKGHFGVFFSSNLGSCFSNVAI